MRITNTIVLAAYGKERGHKHGDCMDALRHELGARVLTMRYHSQIDQVRSALANAAIDQGADVTVFIDSDSEFDPLDVEKIADSARETKGIVGAPYSRRSMRAAVVGGFDLGLSEITMYEGGGLVLCPGSMGMGFTAIHRDVYQRISKLPEYEYVKSDDDIVRPYFRKLIVDGQWLYEDASFCHVARSVGSALHMDTRIRVGHIGEYTFRVEDCVAPRMPDQGSLKLRLK